MGDFGNPGKQAFRALRGIGEGKAPEQRLSHALAKHGRYVILLADIDSKVEHPDHRYLLGFWVRVIWTCQEKCSREPPQSLLPGGFEAERSVAEFRFKSRRRLMRPPLAAFYGKQRVFSKFCVNLQTGV